MIAMAPLVLGRATAVLAFVWVVLATVLGVVVALRALQGYRRVGDPGLLALAAGIALLGAGPPVVNLALTNWTELPAAAVRTGVNGVQLLGLLLMLGVVYGTRGTSRPDAARERDADAAGAREGSTRE